MKDVSRTVTEQIDIRSVTEVEYTRGTVVGGGESTGGKED
jgi:hypothetical protein